MKRFTFKYGLTPNLIIAAKFGHYRLNCQDLSRRFSPSSLAAMTDSYKVTHVTDGVRGLFQKDEMQSQKHCTP